MLEGLTEPSAPPANAVSEDAPHQQLDAAALRGHQAPQSPAVATGPYRGARAVGLRHPWVVMPEMIGG
jgi:hypothetical protein